jgi:hypothetical protein
VTVPVGVEDGGGVPAEERKLVRGAAALIERDDGKGAASAGLPVDREVFGVGLKCMSAGVTRSRAGELTLIRFVSHAFLEMRMLS